MRNLIVLASVVAIAFCSCSNPRYINSPSAYNASFFRQRGDMKFSASASVNPSTFDKNFSAEDDDVDNTFGFDGQAGFALSDHFLIEVGGMHRTETDHFSDDDLTTNDVAMKVGYKRSMFNLGLGYYTPMGRSGKNYFNLILEGAVGKVTSNDDSDPYSDTRHRTYEANPFKLTLKPGFNFFANEVFRMSVAPRFSMLKLNNIKTNYSATEEETLGYNRARSNVMTFFEPAIHLQAGPRNADWLKFDLGFNFSTNPLTGDNNNGGPPLVTESYDLYSRSFLLTFGLSFYPFKR